MDITKAQAKALLGLATDTMLADHFGISKQTVSQWGGDDAPLPVGRQWELRARHPDVFGLDPQANPKAA